MATSFDPSTTATQLATLYTQAAQSLLNTQSKNAQNTSTALTQLKSALQAFDGALASLSAKKGLVANSAIFSDTSLGTASATAAAEPGTYSFFVEQLATTHQVAFEDLPAVPVAMGGPLTVQLADGSSFNVNLENADLDNDGTLSQSEIARAINEASGNAGKVVASVITVGAQTQLVLSAGQSGEAGAITLDTSSLPASALKTALDAPKVLVAGQDAVVWLGDQGSGIKMQQASNTFTSITGVSMTFTRAMSTGDTPVTLTVAGDSGATAGNVQSFVDAYNTLMKAIGGLTSKGDREAGTSAAVFASDAGVRALHSRLNNIIRQDYGGIRLAELGVIANRDGTLALDKTKLEAKLAANPDALDTVFGSTSLSAPSGMLGSLDTYLDQWLNSATGQIKRRQDSIQSMQKALTARQARLDTQYDSAYQRYLKQFTALQSLSSRMDETSSLFANLGTSIG